MTIQIPASSDGAASTGRGEDPVGAPSDAVGRVVRAPAFNPAAIAGNYQYTDRPHVLYAPVLDLPDGPAERQLIEQGARLTTAYFAYGAAAKATLAAGNGSERMWSGGAGLPVMLDGNLPLDRWGWVLPLMAVGTDLASQASGGKPLMTLRNGAINPDENRISRSGTNVLASRIHIAGTPGALAQFTLTTPPTGTCTTTTDTGSTGGVVNNRRLTSVTPTTGWVNGMSITGPGIPAGATILSGAGTSVMVISAAATASATGVAITGSSEIPADRLVTLWGWYDSSLTDPLRIGVAGVFDASSASGGGSAETAGDTAPGLYTRPWTGGRTSATAGGVVGSDFDTLATGVKIGLPAFFREPQTAGSGAGRDVRLPTITIDLDGDQDAWPDTATLYDQGTGWNPNGPNSVPELHQALASAVTGMGCRSARVEHVLDKGDPGGVGGWPNVWAQMDDLYAGGVRRFHITAGYNTAGSPYTAPADPAAWAARVRDLLVQSAARLPGCTFAVSCWNEPDLDNFWPGGASNTAALVTLFLAMHAAISDLPVEIGVCENSSWANSAMAKAMLTAAHDAGLPVHFWPIHDYSGDLAYMHSLRTQMRAFLTGLGDKDDFIAADVQLVIGEWSDDLQAWSQFEASSGSFASWRENSSRTEELPAFMYQYLAQGLEIGVAWNVFTRLQIIGPPPLSLAAIESYWGMWTADAANPRPLPALAAMQAWWAHNGGTRIPVTHNGWPGIAAHGTRHGNAIRVSYGNWRPSHPRGHRDLYLTWQNPDTLPARYTWRRLHLDRDNQHNGVLSEVQSGNQDDGLPPSIRTGNLAVGVIEIAAQ